MILIAGQANVVRHDLAALGPSTLVRALAAAVIAGMVSFPIALVAGVVIGVTEAVVRFNFLDEPGLIDFLLFARRARRGLRSRADRPGRDADLLVRAEGAADPRAAPRGLVGAATSTR